MGTAKLCDFGHQRLFPVQILEQYLDRFPFHIVRLRFRSNQTAFTHCTLLHLDVF